MMQSRVVFQSERRPHSRKKCARMVCRRLRKLRGGSGCHREDDRVAAFAVVRLLVWTRLVEQAVSAFSLPVIDVNRRHEPFAGFRTLTVLPTERMRREAPSIVRVEDRCASAERTEVHLPYWRRLKTV